jgi:leucyl aminopeptidase
MQFSFTTESLQDTRAQVLVCFVTQFDEVADAKLKTIDRATEGAVAALLKSKEFTGRDGEIVTLYKPRGFKAERLLLLGLGSAESQTPDSFRRGMGSLSRTTSVRKSRTMAVHFGGISDADCYQAAVEGYLLGSYTLLDHKTGEAAKDKSQITRISFSVGRKALLSRLEKAVTRGSIIAEGQILTRNLTQTPSNKLTPQLYAEKIETLAKQYKVGCRVLDEAAIRKERMGALLSVSKGSVEPPRFIILQHKGGPKGQQPIVLVGKGVTFDSGGISLKPGKDMHEMKQDMAGSAVVLATVLTASRLGIPRNIVGLIPATENMPSGVATRPGDIITSRNGKTIEIINTDAEGRLILADALDYADKFDPQAVIDVATLTGAALFVLGYSGAPIMGNNEKLMDLIRAASDVTSERVWELPIWDDFRDQMKSSIADLVNSGGRSAGTAAAGAFLENFVGDWPWVHIDIAYVDLEPKGRPYVPRGATGFGVRLLTEVLSKWKKV